MQFNKFDLINFHSYFWRDTDVLSIYATYSEVFVSSSLFLLLKTAADVPDDFSQSPMSAGGER